VSTAGVSEWCQVANCTGVWFCHKQEMAWPAAPKMARAWYITLTFGMDLTDK